MRYSRYHYYPDVYRRYDPDPYYDRYYNPYHNPYYFMANNQISNVNQNIYNSGYMNDVYQSSVINQYSRIR